MTYLLKEVAKTDEEKIFSDFQCDERKSLFLRMRGGFFENNENLPWVHDSLTDSYLFRAPKPDIRAFEYRFYFRFAGVAYEILVDPARMSVARVIDSASELIRQPFSEALIKALMAHGTVGEGSRPLLDICTVQFEGEEK